MTRTTTYVVGALAIGVIGVGVVNIAAAMLGDRTHQGEHDSQAAIADRGRRVMPFDLERSTHRFVNTLDGGIQTVVSDDGDRKQIALIRAHLGKELQRFRQGVFDDPVTIHGPEMAGVAEIRAGAAHIDIAYTELITGARLRYRTDDAQLVDALHRWFDAQVSDHGEHAEDG